MYDYSIVVPVFNSEYMLVKLFESLGKVFVKLEKTVQFVFVDDGSEDSSWEVLKGIKKSSFSEAINSRGLEQFFQLFELLFRISSLVERIY